VERLPAVEAQVDHASLAVHLCPHLLAKVVLAQLTLLALADKIEHMQPIVVLPLIALQLLANLPCPRGFRAAGATRAVPASLLCALPEV